MTPVDEGERDRKAILEELHRAERTISRRRAEGGNLKELKELEQRWLHLQSELVRNRLHPRLPFLAEAWVTLPDGTQVPAQTKDVSLGGVALRSIPGCLASGDVVRIEMTLVNDDDSEQMLHLDGVVAWTTGDCAGVSLTLAASKRVLPLLQAAMARAVASLEQVAIDEGDEL